ncbi:MAG TPA: glycosyltransferase [Polyangiaceae bacterium]|nr:glycosyltransferase [Polyangiaceae bacterium]
MPDPRVLIVVPTYNERDSLPILVDAVFAIQPEAHILVVDDASPDGTGKLADEMAERDPRLHVMHRAGKRGLGSAYVEGFSWGLARTYDQFIEMDADMSHDPRYLSALIAALDDGADLAVGSRNIPEGASKVGASADRSSPRAARSTPALSSASASTTSPPATKPTNEPPSRRSASTASTPTATRSRSKPPFALCAADSRSSRSPSSSSTDVSATPR